MNLMRMTLIGKMTLKDLSRKKKASIIFLGKTTTSLVNGLLKGKGPHIMIGNTDCKTTFGLNFLKTSTCMTRMTLRNQRHTTERKL